MPDTTHERNAMPDVLTLLEEELKSCVMPDIKDSSNATTEDIVKDMHRVLTGNGGVTHGLIYKVAAANVNSKLLRSCVNDTVERLDEQIGLCEAVQTEKKRQAIITTADIVDARKVRTIVWANRYLIIAILTAVVMTAISTTKPSAPTAAVQPVETVKELHRIQKMIETIMKLQGLDAFPEDDTKTASKPSNKTPNGN